MENSEPPCSWRGFQTKHCHGVAALPHSGFRASGFDFPSGFGFRLSDLDIENCKVLRCLPTGANGILPLAKLVLQLAEWSLHLANLDFHFMKCSFHSAKCSFPLAECSFHLTKWQCKFAEWSFPLAEW